MASDPYGPDFLANTRWSLGFVRRERTILVPTGESLDIRTTARLALGDAEFPAGCPGTSPGCPEHIGSRGDLSDIPGRYSRQSTRYAYLRMRRRGILRPDPEIRGSVAPDPHRRGDALPSGRERGCPRSWHRTGNPSCSSTALGRGIGSLPPAIRWRRQSIPRIAAASWTDLVEPRDRREARFGSSRCIDQRTSSEIPCSTRPVGRGRGRIGLRSDGGSPGFRRSPGHLFPDSIDPPQQFQRGYQRRHEEAEQPLTLRMGTSLLVLARCRHTGGRAAT